MKEISQADKILNEYIINNTDTSPIAEPILNHISINKNFKHKIQSGRNSLKKLPFKKYNCKTSNHNKFSSYINLINAIENNNPIKVKEYLNDDTKNINALNKNGISPLHIAVINGNLEIINYMLNKGANPNITSLHKKQTPLHYAYIFKSIKTNKIISLLLKYKANPNLEDINNKKPKEYSLKYKESSDIDDYTSSYENYNEKNDIKCETKNNDLNNFDSFIDNNNKNTYSISDTEETIIQNEANRNNGFSIEQLINPNDKNYNKCKIKIISKKNKNNNIEYYQRINKGNISYSNNKNLNLSIDNDTFVDSLEINRQNYSNNTFNKSYHHNRIKTKNLKQQTSLKNLKLNKNFLLKVSSIGHTTINSEIKQKPEININKQYFFNNEFFNNYYSDKKYYKSKTAKKIFKIPKHKEKNNNVMMSSSMASTDIQTTKKGKNNNNNIIMNNNVAEFVYTEEKQLDEETKKLQYLKSWLESLQLSEYYNIFVNNNITDINYLINEYKSKRNKINYQYIENLLNIHISGHIYRILSKLEIDAGFIENKIGNFLIGLNYSETQDNSNKNLSRVYIQGNECSDKCYNCCNIRKPLMEKKDLKTFLRKYRILHLYNNFYHNGFNLINFVILQMYTKFSINDDIVQKCFRIYNKKDRYLVLEALFNEVKEINIFFSTNMYYSYLFPRYENNDWGINWYEESINEENISQNQCIIF